MKETLSEDIASSPSSYGCIHLNKDEFVTALDELTSLDEITSLRKKTGELKRLISSSGSTLSINEETNGHYVVLRSDVLNSELDQIL